MESDISLSLCSDQALVKGKQCLVDFIHIIVSSFDKIFYNDIEFTRMGKGKTCLAEHLLHLGHYIGSLQRRVQLQNAGDFDRMFVFMADVQALNTPFLTFFTTVSVISFIIADYSTANK